MNVFKPPEACEFAHLRVFHSQIIYMTHSVCNSAMLLDYFISVIFISISDIRLQSIEYKKKKY